MAALMVLPETNMDAKFVNVQVSVCHRSVSMAAVYQLKIKYGQDKFRVIFLDAKRPVSFPLEDKHVVNEHHVVR